MRQRQLTGSQVASIVNALRHIAPIYKEDAAVSHDTPRLAAQFEQQAEDAETLADMLDEAMRVVLE